MHYWYCESHVNALISLYLIKLFEKIGNLYMLTLLYSWQNIKKIEMHYWYCDSHVNGLTILYLIKLFQKIANLYMLTLFWIADQKIEKSEMHLVMLGFQA